MQQTFYILLSLLLLRCWAIGFDLISLRCQHGLAVVVCGHDVVDDGHQTPERLLLTQKQQDDGSYTVHALSINKVISFNVFYLLIMSVILRKWLVYGVVVLVAFVLFFVLVYLLSFFTFKKNIFLGGCHFSYLFFFFFYIF